MQASSTDMLTKGWATLMTIWQPVSRISAATAALSVASSAWGLSTPSVFIARFAWTEAMIASHLPRVRLAMWMSPKRSLFCAHLCATTWATPPAPTIRTLRFMGPCTSFWFRG